MTEITIFVEKIFMVKTVIIQHDDRTIDLITKTIESFCPNVGIVATAKNIKSGISIINEHEPDLILLDIKQQDGSGFDLVDHFNPPEFKVIFFSRHW